MKTGIQVSDILKWGAFVFQKTQIELGEIVETEYYIGKGKYETVQYYDAKSNPLVADTDGDGISDDIDSHPWYKEGEWVAELSNKYPGVEYLRIDAGGTEPAVGGDQGWWSAIAKSQALKNYEDFVGDKNYQIGKMGCGLIAVSDLQLYLMQQNQGYEIFAPGVDKNLLGDSTGVLKKNDYMAYVNDGSRVLYEFNGSYLTYKVGLMPSRMEEGLGYFLRQNEHEQTAVKWAPYAFAPRTSHSMLVLEEIEDMLNQDLPVIFAYFTTKDEDKLVMYHLIEDAKEKKEKGQDDEQCKSHYMTIIGLYRYLDEDSTDYEYLLKVTSWGEVYYIRYDDYIEKLSYFSNILRIQ